VLVWHTILFRKIWPIAENDMDLPTPGDSDTSHPHYPGLRTSIASWSPPDQWHVKEGERIPPERELSTQLGVGRTSLREALKALEIMG